MTPQKTIFLAALGALLAGIVAGCAKQGYPSGGPVDRIPPKVKTATPANGTADFAEKEFSFLMDEYVTLKDADNNILVSPPMKEKPEYVVRGHKLIVRIKDTLAENTTYLFQFKGAIADFNEGNALPSFEYVFSTGATIDSMTLRGRVVDAFTLKAPKETVSVLAYGEDMADSAVAVDHPRYFTRCDTGGFFAFNHLAAGRYHIVALVDGDRNMRLNAGEAMAFLDSAVTAVPMPKAKTADTLAKDTLTADTVAADTLTKGATDMIATHQMRLSQLKVEQQRVTGSKAVAPGYYQIVTKTPLTDSFALTHLMADSTLRLYSRRNAAGDTLEVWSAPERLDSIVLLLTDDTLLHDTLKLQYLQRTKAKLSTPEAPGKMKLTSLVGQNHPYYDTLRLGTGTPVVAIDTTKALGVMDLNDSTVSRCTARLLPDRRGDTSFAMLAMADFHGKAGGKYMITVPAGLMTDIYGNSHDTLTFTTTYTKPENYGSITLTVESGRFAAGGQLLVQLTNEKGDILRQVSLAKPGLATFPHLKAGKYTLRLVHDTNGDGQWTPGDYWSRRQPEEVTYLGKVLDLRENWEITERFHW